MSQWWPFPFKGGWAGTSFPTRGGRPPLHTPTGVGKPLAETKATPHPAWKEKNALGSFCNFHFQTCLQCDSRFMCSNVSLRFIYICIYMYVTFTYIYLSFKLCVGTHRSEE